jgi:DNA polymerase type B, organellar and viral
MTKFQNYRKYRLPITINPLEYGKLIYQNINFYVMFINNRNLALIDQNDLYNQVKIYTNGELNFEYKDHKLENNCFVRSIENNKFTFKDNKIIRIEKVILILIIFYLFIIFPENNLNMAMVVLSNKNIVKLRKVSSKNSWNSFTININSKIFTKTLFKNKFNKFWSQIENKFTEHNHMFILLKIKYVNGEIATIGDLQRINNSDKDWYINWIINNMEFKSEYYNETQIESFIISYGFKEGHIENKDNLDSNINFQNYNNNNLVISFNPLDFGKVLTVNPLANETLYILQNKDNLIIKILSSENQNSIEIFKDATLTIKFTDFKLGENKFVRIIKNKQFYFENNQQILFSKENKTKFISVQQKSKNLINNFITLDIETYIKNNVLIPYCISIYDGKETYSYFISDYKDSKELILTALRSIMIRKYNGYNIYIHNMAKFDIIFLLKHLVKLGDVTPIIHNGRIISINLNFGKDLEYRLQFKDSYLILLASLSKLTKGFGVETLKSIFPFLFVNEDNLDYTGQVPDIKYFGNNITTSDYNIYSSKFDNNWNLRKETIKYCEIDCISLYQVIFKFSELIFSLFGKNIHKYPTLPSLAFAIFRTIFMEENSIPQLSGKIANDIRQSYTGGAVDMYIPQNKQGTKIYCYDVNSLYPYVMKEFDMPVGNAIYFEGNIRAIDPNAFGFFFCEIIAPDNIKHPIIQTHVKINNMTRTIAPIGIWEDMIFSEELINAEKFGYKFNILWGYKFERKNIFKDYVTKLYNLRLQYPKSNPLNLIAKLLLNSLYGRFGMIDSFSTIEIINEHSKF